MSQALHLSVSMNPSETVMLQTRSTIGRLVVCLWVPLVVTGHLVHPLAHQSAGHSQRCAFLACASDSCDEDHHAGAPGNASGGRISEAGDPDQASCDSGCLLCKLIRVPTPRLSATPAADPSERSLGPAAPGSSICRLQAVRDLPSSRAPPLA